MTRVENLTDMIFDSCTNSRRTAINHSEEEEVPCLLHILYYMTQA